MRKILFGLLFLNNLAFAQDQNNIWTSQVVELLKDSSASNQAMRNWPEHKSKLNSKLVVVDGKIYQGLQADVMFFLHRIDSTIFLFRNQLVSADFKLDFINNRVDIASDIKITQTRANLPDRAFDIIETSDNNPQIDEYSDLMLVEILN